MNRLIRIEKYCLQEILRELSGILTDAEEPMNTCEKAMIGETLSELQRRQM